MEMNMLQDLIIAVFNMFNMSKEKDVLDQYEEASFILHEILLQKIGKCPDYHWTLKKTGEKNETDNNQNR